MGNDEGADGVQEECAGKSVPRAFLIIQYRCCTLAVMADRLSGSKQESLVNQQFFTQRASLRFRRLKQFP